jgi:hypothetical protein
MNLFAIGLSAQILGPKSSSTSAKTFDNSRRSDKGLDFFTAAGPIRHRMIAGRLDDFKPRISPFSPKNATTFKFPRPAQDQLVLIVGIRFRKLENNAANCRRRGRPFPELPLPRSPLPQNWRFPL